jgi:hypothetical protein
MQAPESPRHIAVFFYGLFMDVDLLRSKGADPHNVRAASLPGFALRIGRRATLVPDPTARAHGMLMEMSREDVDLLYSEASVSAYRPEPVVVQLADGSRVAAVCFNLPVAPAPDEANPDYAAKLRTLAQRLGLPADYVERMR